MDTKKIEDAQKILKDGGNVIKTREDRDLILVDKDGKVQNLDDCVWLPRWNAGTGLKESKSKIINL